MQNANDGKIGERTFVVSLVTIGLTAGISAFDAEPMDMIIMILLGLTSILIVVFGFHRRFVNYFRRIGGSKLMNFLAIYMPLVGVLTLVLYPIAIGIAASIKANVDITLMLTAITYGLSAIANLVVLILNIISLVRRKKASQA